MEASYCKVEGITSTRVGYAGGDRENPTYEDVCSGKTGHAESVEVEFDPAKISYEKLLQVFWDLHDPTQVNSQGPDFGEQYRSVIFYTTPDQKAKALASKESLERSGRYRKPIATQIVQAGKFWPAEEYHQRYLEKHRLAACRV